MPKVVIAGPASWNTLVAVHELPQPHPQTIFATGHSEGLGGTSSGKALTLARLGVDVTFRTALGDDGAAADIRASLTHPRLTVVAERGHGPSERHLNLMASDGARLSIYLSLPPDPGPIPAPVREAIAGADVVIADLADHARQVLPLARAAGRPLWCDLHDYDGSAEYHREFLEAADVVVVSGDRLPDVRAFLTAAVDGGARWAICTLGARGASALGRDEGWVQVSAVPVERVVDTNGAGDAFVAGALLGHLEGRPLGECLRFGAAAGALTVQSPDLAAETITPEAVLALAGLARTRSG